MDEKFLIKKFNDELDTLLNMDEPIDSEKIEENELLEFAQGLKSLDFSSESSIRESLKEKLLLLKNESKKQKDSVDKGMEEDELSLDELDYVAGGISNEASLEQFKILNDKKKND